MATITVTLDAELVQRAEELARAKNMSIQAYLEQLLSGAAENTIDISKLSPRTRDALGILKGLPDRPYKELVEEALMEKYGDKK